ncbi:type II toxin-antitoxin system VapC family toxin [Microcella humidisoli]|uniref:Ribonuclease VapC n=1 Tax=Microcella humidisoli TaxID=2963406 RepID=A0ABY5FWB4_9MICO|nr:PIN domain-containing protein [Microcella humidisoli]UTT62596.1 PIN domain-containing protein [Microcella humidisoli]
MIYLDSCILIYAVEDEGERGRLARQALADHADDELVVSPLVVMECLTGPLKRGDLALVDYYRATLDAVGRTPFDEAVFVRAAELRARHAISTPDALHLAAAQKAACTALWTNDRRLERAAHGLAVAIFEAS